MVFGYAKINFQLDIRTPTDNFNFRETVFANGKFFHLFFLTNVKQMLLSQEN